MRGINIACTWEPASINHVSQPIVTKTPLADAVKTRGKRAAEVPFHVPGHKRGSGATPALLSVVSRETLQHDLTELRGLDYLSSPSGCIAEAQAQASAVFGSDHSWFLVNGCSGGIHAAVMATYAPGDVLMLPRNCHLSAFAAMVFSGSTPQYLQPDSDASFGVAHCVSPFTVQTALETAAAAGKLPAALLLLSPTYYGVCAHTAEICAMCHHYDVPVIVDEAHGAHLGRHEQLPKSALACGADIVIQSTHKVLGAMTQAAMIHSQGHLVDHTRIAKALQLLQSSSPSYLLLSSLDAATAQASDPRTFDVPMSAARVIRKGVQRLSGLHLLDPQHAGPSCADIDPLRITIGLHVELGLTGFEMAAELENKWGIVSEVATQQVVVFALGPGTQMAHAHKLVTALEQWLSMAQRARHSPAAVQASTPAPAAAPSWQVQSTLRLTPREAFMAKTERVAFRDAVGRTSAELLCPYPPGVPVAWPGELISAHTLDVLAGVVAQGGVVTGADDPTLQHILVVKEDSTTTTTTLGGI